MSDLPDRIVVGKNGAYWRDFGTHYSMAVVSTDNDPVEPVAVYVRESEPDPEVAASVDALADALNGWDQGEEPRPDAHRHWNVVMAAALRAVQPSPDTGLDAERLARAISKHHRRSYVDMIDTLAAKAIKAEYDRLATTPSSEGTET